MEKQDNLSSNPDRRRTTAAERTKMMERYRASGLTRLAFCQREGISIYKLDSWLRREKSPQKGKGVVLREVPWSSSTTAGNWAMELISPGGWTIRRREPISVEEIGRLLRAEKC
jgi:hypothetical protein